MGKNKHDDDDVSEDGYDSGDEASDDDAELFTQEVIRDDENK